MKVYEFERQDWLGFYTHFAILTDIEARALAERFKSGIVIPYLLKDDEYCYFYDITENELTPMRDYTDAFSSQYYQLPIGKETGLELDLTTVGLRPFTDKERKMGANPFEYYIKFIEQYQFHYILFSDIDGFEKEPRFLFTPFWHEYDYAGIFSQWWAENDITVEGVSYKSCEHYMMAKKALLFGDTYHYKQILEASTPKEAKVIGKKVTPFDQKKWDSCRLEILLNGNRAKFRQGTIAADILMSTAGTILMEASPLDNIYGIKLSADDPAAYNPYKWNGTNDLGNVLMEIREELIQQKERY